MANQRLIILLCLIACICADTFQDMDNAKAELEKYIEKKIPEINRRYKPEYHLTSAVGWINDPNGFSFYKGYYHLFYQFYPYDSVWGPMHWGHSKSTDLVSWERLPTALLPEEEGCFSGSAVVENDTMILMYTAHIVKKDESYNQYQYLAFSDDGVNFEKYAGNPVLDPGPNGSPDFRDPKAWKHGDHFYVVIGSKTPDQRGTVLLYRSKDMISWEFLSTIIESHGDLGYMLECPDFFELDGKFVLLMSPQGMEPQGDRYKNIYQTGYIIGSFDYETFQFVPEVPFQEIDYGHDFYAAQTMENDGKRYLVGWFNTWEKELQEAKDGWCGSMTIVRELSISNNRINMKSVDAMVNLRDDIVADGDFDVNQVLTFNKTAEIIIVGDLNEGISLAFEGTDGGGSIFVRYDTEIGKIVVDRDEDDRQVEWNPTESKELRIFLDSSSLELFCGDGEAVFSSRVFPDGGWKVTNVGSTVLKVKAFSLKSSISVYRNTVEDNRAT